MDEFVCRICLSMDGVEHIFKREDQELSRQLQLVGRVSIVENDHLPQCICQACSHELQLAYDLILQYAASYNKLKTVHLQNKTAKESPSSVNFLENMKKVPTRKMLEDQDAGNTLVAEIVVKEELLSDDDEKIECLKSKAESSCSEDADKDRFRTKATSNEVYADEKVKLNSDNGNFDRDQEKSDDDVCRAQGDEEKYCNEFLDASSMKSIIIDIVVKEETKLADELMVNAENFAAKPKPKDLASSDEQRATERIATNKSEIVSKRFYGNFQVQEEFRRELKAESEILPCFESRKHVKISKRVAKAKEQSVKTAKLTKCPQLFVRLKKLKMYIVQENFANVNSNPARDACDKETFFSSEQPLLELQIEHSNRGGFKCESCGKWFSCRKKFRTHRMMHLNLDRFKCEECSKTFSSKKILNQHRITHSNPELLACEQCGKSFSMQYLLKKHQKWHSDPNLFKCDHCGKRYASKHTLADHEITHSNPELVTCDKCGKTFSEKRSMMRHQKWHMNPVACDQCGSIFSSEEILEQHKIKHSNPELVTCEKCGKSFGNEYLLKMHLKLHLNPDAFKCELCDKRFTSKANLRKHTILHSNPESLKCEQCNKSFSKPSSLREHQVLHSNPDAFKCGQCGKRCSNKKNLEQHKITHSNPDLVTCGKCGIRFSEKGSLKRHQKRHLNSVAFKSKA